ncbi:UBP-type zinc finger domain-containing protein [Mucilaginibacter sp. L3T2-6]|uniref:UBP-type zinc finger domain-containing protein n=1 Tax=Mucilaginibacter sp. L3T2-6 TaxID=3062491 RepID=UPI00267741FB|nr:UBP-type zinc finger domain-containing protein [Mucilaginibacter sp. L3T2-6]MDO3642145.1 UBP-type zinc finger domain-containing protein [Mucilaginibacter sp. L3T2-6]MDV6214639.1 UBP-type zinc finger domain-containing protein [Mucilaginibacter sp. L3T2-6]
MENEVCQHLAAIKSLKKPKDYVCEECIKTHSSWMHLRTCQTCGVTLCCDSSPNKHASKHAAEHNHPVVISAEPGERWLWCYVDEEMAEY